MVWSLATGGTGGATGAAAAGVGKAAVGKAAVGKTAGADTIRKAVTDATKGKPQITKPPGGDKSGIRPPDKLNKPGVGDKVAKATSDLQILHAVQQQSGLSDAEIRAADQLYRGRVTLNSNQQADILKQFPSDRHGLIQNAAKEIGDQKFLQDAKDAAERAQNQKKQDAQKPEGRFRNIVAKVIEHELIYGLSNMSRAGQAAQGPTRGFMNVMHTMLAA